MKNPTVKEMVKAMLITNGYDGLCGDYCGCGIDDIMPCCEGINECQAGYKVLITEDNKQQYEDCEMDVGDWIICLDKEDSKNEKEK